MLFVIAERVGVPVYQLEEEMPLDELFEWMLLLDEEAEEQKKREREQQAKTRTRPPRR